MTATGTTPAPVADRWETVRAVSLPVIAGFLVRAIPVLTADFPLNDGGLFYTMTRDLQAAHYALPAFTSYNGLQIPFVYPPLGFYAAGLLSDATGMALIDVFRFLPLVVATLTIPALYLLAREILPTRFQAILATWAFALLPRAFSWLVLGGGVTRSIGLLFAILTLVAAVRFFRTGRRRDLVGMGVLAALTAVSHPSAALFTGISVVLLLLAYRRTWQALRDSVLAGGLAVLVASPWWVSAIATHGIGPFISGGQTGTDLAASFQYLATFDFTDEPYIGFLAALGLLGFLREISVRRYLLPAWVLIVLVADQRGATTGAMVPLAMLVAVAIDEVVLARLSSARGGTADDPPWPPAVVGDRFGRLFLVAALIVALAGAAKAPVDQASPLHALPTASRDAMEWISANAPPSARFVVVTGSLWFIDAASEWFPVLAGHESVATVQGYEWQGKAEWSRQAARNVELQLCAYKTVDCLSDWLADAPVTRPWVYVPEETTYQLVPTGDCCAGFRASLEASGAYDVVYDGPGGAVFRPRP